MGNCINPSTRSWQNEEDDSTKELHQEKGVEPVKESGNVEKAASIKVKLVLTKGGARVVNVSAEDQWREEAGRCFGRDREREIDES
ncbi:hypothetical protein OIU74_013092 [Salix koriyanagi]|uniref:Uncharacterized protein n=1 Tax=Salix koriyanagi TaxID=2511006 RepID=A0A9Q0T588_9ROSI|nr:hypothetical protein OIU74_013092 [Salix koriyanagi]